MNDLKLSVVLPIYNEHENIPILLEEVRAAIAPLGIRYEIVAVDDGSTDSSHAVLRESTAVFPMLRVLAFEKNAGQTAALDAGWRASRGELVVSLDADLQNDPADIPGMLRTLEESAADMVIGVRVNRQDTAWRRFQSRLGNGVRNWITGDHITDTGCSLKMLRRECIDRVKLFNGMHRFLPTLLRIEGYRVIEMPVNHRQRRFGTSKYGVANRALRGLSDCFAVRWMRKRSFRYRVRPESE
jgi:glycosyltransferase involved in cell wall biosynthesis